MANCYFNEKRMRLRRQGTHVDQFGDIYKRVNEKLYKYRECKYFSDITYPCWVTVDNETEVILTERVLL